MPKPSYFEQLDRQIAGKPGVRQMLHILAKRQKADSAALAKDLAMEETQVRSLLKWAIDHELVFQEKGSTAFYLTSKAVGIVSTHDSVDWLVKYCIARAIITHSVSQGATPDKIVAHLQLKLRLSLEQAQAVYNTLLECA